MTATTIRPYHLDLITTEEQLTALWLIDKAAYGDCSISFESFRRWWDIYDIGLRAVYQGEQIKAALGLWGLSEVQTRQFIGGELAEAALTPLSDDELANGSQFWYCSGVVSLSRARLDSPLRRLLVCSASSWLMSGHVQFPLWLYALGYSEEGLAMLRHLKFEQVQSAESMADGVPLYGLRLESADRVRGLLS